MLTATALAHLHRHQDALLALLDEAATLIARGTEQDRQPSATMRWTIARRARAYQLFKHVEIFDPAIAFGSPAQAATATEMRRACLALSADHEAHCRHWAGRDVMAEWGAYADATTALIGRLRRHVAIERRDVERLLAGSERLRRL